MNEKYVLGLDLGQAHDYSAVSIVEHIPTGKPDAYPADDGQVFHVRHLDRFALGTKYTQIVTQVAEMTKAPLLAGKVRLALDATGVGRGITDMFLAPGLGAKMTPITITAGDTMTHEWEGGCERFRVPKRDLVGIVQLLLQDRRLRVSPELSHAETLTRELQDFKWKITDAGNDIYGAWREGQHDDLLLSVALACWTFGNMVDRRLWRA